MKEAEDASIPQALYRKPGRWKSRPTAHRKGQPCKGVLVFFPEDNRREPD
jgi:hypothetical protein